MRKKDKKLGLPSYQYYKDTHIGMSVEAIKQSVLDHLYFNLIKIPHTATLNDWYMALVYALRDRMVKQWIKTLKNLTEDIKIIAYLSSEFLIGPQLEMNLLYLDIYKEVSQAFKELGIDLKELIKQEKEPGLGYGSIGRLAACYLDSLTTLNIPTIGYGIFYEFGPFEQEIRDGWQIAKTEKWLLLGNPWEILRPEVTYNVNFGGHTESYYDEQDYFRVRWIPKFSIKGVAHDFPLLGYKVGITNLLRLWKAEAIESFDFEAFNKGDYFGALCEKIASESISKILYPDDEPYSGKHLRLAQQYFFVSCALQDMIRLHLLRWKNIESFPTSFAVHLNNSDTAIAVAELMRLLVDEHLVSWEKAWYITQNTFSYTNHSVIPENLEKWPVPLFADILPRHLEIIYEINRRFLNEICIKYPNDNDKLSRLSLIDEMDQKYVRMVHLVSLGSNAINCVSSFHLKLLKDTFLSDFYEIYHEKFLNITNGVSQRRWILLNNRRLAELITNTIGDCWINQPKELKKLEPYAEDKDFLKKWMQTKYHNKSDLTEIIYNKTGNLVNPHSLFDIHMTRIHEYKRQHLNILYIITLFNRIKNNPQIEVTPRTFIFSGKTSPGYFIANLIIKLINSVADVINNDQDIAGRLKVIFLPNFNVKNSHKIYASADISEQIAQPNREISGIGGIKFSMNGALTIGTFTGLNTELYEEIGAENFFLFGMTPEEISKLKYHGYNPIVYYNTNPNLKEVINLIGSGFFSRRDVNLFKPLVDSLLCRDEQMVLADYQSYVDCQDLISTIFKDQEKWVKKSILTVSHMGKFSSDRAISEYNKKIWHIAPLKIDYDGI
ncbi:MAG: glycogen/starch/alpha-glucan phosphorylase [Nitrospirae bacterium]|nr:glycogen/starch/alpha-glucan phosphorylase [Nitrospirota bacterium]